LNITPNNFPLKKIIYASRTPINPKSDYIVSIFVKNGYIKTITLNFSLLIVRKYYIRPVNNAQNIRFCKRKRNISGSNVFSRSYRIPINLNVMPFIIIITLCAFICILYICMCINPTRPRTTSIDNCRYDKYRFETLNGRDVIGSDDFIF